MCKTPKPSKLIEEVIAMHDEYLKSDEMLAAIQRERDLLVLKTRINVARKEGLATGRAEGIKHMIVNYCQKTFNEYIKEWLDSLSSSQLQIIEENIFDVSTIEELKKLIIK